MKRKLIVAAAMMLAAGGLTACSGGPDKEQVMQKTIDGFDRIRSAELDSNVKMTVGSGNSRSGNMDMDMNVTYTTKPKASKVVVKSKLANGSSNVIEAVCDSSDVYIRMPSTGKWYRKPASSYDTVSRSRDQSVGTAAKYLKMMKKNKVDYEIGSKGGNYVLTFNAGKKFTDKLKRDIFTQMSSTGSTRLSSSALDRIDFKKFKYVIEVDKRRCLPKNYRIDLKMTVENGGSKGTVNELCKGTYSNVNSVKKIEIPSSYIDLTK